MRNITGYTEQAAIEDWKSLQFNKLTKRIRRKQSLIYTSIATLEDILRGVPYPQ